MINWYNMEFIDLIFNQYFKYWYYNNEIYKLNIDE